MVPHLRRAFNAAFTEERYQEYYRRLCEASRSKIEFRVAESPIFLPREFRDEMVQSGKDIIGQLLRPEHQRHSLAAVPPEYDVPACDHHPLFAQIDFAVTREGSGGALAPRLIELQAFPSLYGFQLVQAIEARRFTPDGGNLRFLLSGLDVDGYKALLRGAILGEHRPENVVLFDVDPPSQKTSPDFWVTEDICGIRAVCPTKVEKRGRELWYDLDGKKTRILRIYNRVIVDELQVKKISLPFSYTEPLDVEWAGHPNWYFRWSKHSLPEIDHPSVPTARFLSDFDRWPDDLERWVLKPLFSFAGVGVKVDVTKADLDAVPLEHRKHTLLMKKVDYAPVIETADGQQSKCEVRIMFIWSDHEPKPVTTLVRMSQGKMMGVDFNRNRTWVGSSAALWEE